MTFPVAYDPDVAITERRLRLHGDPYAVFVNGDGTISAIVAGRRSHAAGFTADEEKLIPSGS